MNIEELVAAGVPLTGDDALAVLYAETALDWIAENTTLKVDKGNMETVKALPACAKLFMCKFAEVIGQREGVASQSIEGLSMSFSTTAKNEAIWQLANALLGGYLKSRVQVFPAKRRW